MDSSVESGGVVERRVQENYDPTLNDIFRNRPQEATAQEIKNAMDNVILSVIDKRPTATALETYRAIADKVPQHIPGSVQRVLLSAMVGPDGTIIQSNVNTIAMLNMRSVISSVTPILRKDPAYNDEIMQEAFRGVLERIPGLVDEKGIAAHINTAAQNAAASYIGKVEELPRDWILSRKEKQLKAEADAYFDNKFKSTDLMGGYDVDVAAREIANRIDSSVSAGSISSYIKRRGEALHPMDDRDSTPSTALDQVQRQEIRKVVNDVFEDDPISREIIASRMGFVDNPMNAVNTARKMNMTINEFRTQQGRALNRLREPQNAKKLNVSDKVDQ
ncbi:MAG TPA: hypothetical protein VG917_03670 [Patescibacteria group bacterium]|nr:hypothetical protein [Patescibacteria group bacterium]